MKRILKGVLLLGLTVGWAGARAQTAPAGRASVYAIKEPTDFSEFVVPQVRLPNTATATRINRQLLQQIIAGNVDGKINSMASARVQLRQASAMDYFNGSHYKVLLNQGNLLSLEFTLSFRGAYDYERIDHAVFDLRTGQRLALADLLADPTAQMRHRLAGAINRRIGEFLADTATYDTATIASLAEAFHWNPTTRGVNFQAHAAPGTEEPALNDFALAPGTLLLFYRVGLSYSQLSSTPDDTFRFPFARLHPRGLLVPLAWGIKAKKS